MPPILPADLISVIPPKIKRSYSSIRNLFSVNNYTQAHYIGRYSEAIFKHAQRHDLLPEVQQERFNSQQALYYVSMAEEVISRAAVYEKRLSLPLREAMYEGVGRLNSLLGDWQKMTNANPEMLKKAFDPDPVVHTAEATTQRIGWWSRVGLDRFMKQEVRGTLAEEEPTPLARKRDNDDALRPALQVRSMQRTWRIDEIVKVFDKIEKAMTDEDRAVMQAAEELRSLPMLVASCRSYSTAVAQEKAADAAMGV